MWEPVLNPLPPGFFAKRYVNESEVLHREIELGEGRARLRVGTLRHGVTGVSGASQCDPPPPLSCVCQRRGGAASETHKGCTPW